MFPFSRFCHKKCFVCLGCKNKHLTKSQTGINCGNDWQAGITNKISVSRIPTWGTRAILIHPPWTKLFWVIFLNWIHAPKVILISEISRFWSSVVEAFNLFGCYVVALVVGYGPIGCSEPVSKNQSTPRKTPEEKDQNTAVLYYIQASFHRKIISLYS